jgi:hypothetical protein
MKTLVSVLAPCTKYTIYEYQLGSWNKEATMALCFASGVSIV